jgi:dipeptidyl-peptidase-4
MRLLPLVLAAGLSLSGSLSVQAAPAVLTPERVFSDPDLSGPDARGVELSPDGKLVTFLRAKPEDRYALDLWAAPVEGNAPARMLVDSAVLEAKGATLSEAELARRERQRIAEHGIVEYKWDDQGRSILVPVSGELYVADARSGALRKAITRGAEGGDAIDAKVSPKGAWLSFVRNGALMIAPMAGGDPHLVSPAGHDAISYGLAEFVAQEEFARDTGYWWSPDDTAIAYARVDETEVDTVTRVGIGAQGATTVSQKFPHAGGKNAVVSLFVQRLAGGAPVAVDLGANTDIYLSRVDWSKDGKVLYVQRQSRDQQTLDLIAVDPATGQGRVIVSEHSQPWLEPNLDFTPLNDGGFLWVSERTGYKHLYLYDKDAKLVRAVTAGDFPLAGFDRAKSVIGVDEAKGIVYVAASKDEALSQQLYVVDYRRGGPMQALTTGDGWWTTRMGKTPNVFVGRYSSYDTPPRTAVYGADGKLRRWLVENPLRAGHPYWPYAENLPKPEFGQLRAEDGQKLDYVILKPIGFDPAKRYPAIVEVYGGPGRQHVKKAWRDPAERLFLEAGFVVFQLDNRGAANRGLKFEAPIYKALGGPEVRDQLVGLKFLKSQPFVDPDHVGVTGWSYGGYMTLRLLTEPGSGFAAGAAGAAPGDWRQYDTHYTEHYMGMPQDDPAAYDAAAILPRLKNLNGRLMLMHGMADDNVLFENATGIMAALQDEGTPFDLMLYPGQKHGVVGQKRRLQQWRLYLEFFKRNLQP